MDDSCRRLTWATGWATVGAAAGGALVAVVLTVVTGEPAGRLLVGLAAAGLLVATILGATLRPRLAADADGLAIRRLRGESRLAWPDVSDLAVVRTRRLGRDVAVLEITGRDPDVLVVLTRLDLGADPDNVLDALRALRRRAP